MLWQEHASSKICEIGLVRKKLILNTTKMGKYAKAMWPICFSRYIFFQANRFLVVEFGKVMKFALQGRSTSKKFLHTDVT